MGEPGNYRWLSPDGEGLGFMQRVIKEDILSEEELVLLRRSPEAMALYEPGGD